MGPLTFEMDPSAMRSKDPPISSVPKLNESFDRSKQSKDLQSLSKGSNRGNHRRGGTTEEWSSVTEGPFNGRTIIAGSQLDVGSSTLKNNSTRNHRHRGTAGRRIIDAGEQLNGGSASLKDRSTDGPSARGTPGTLQQQIRNFASISMFTTCVKTMCG